MNKRKSITIHFNEIKSESNLILCFVHFNRKETPSENKITCLPPAPRITKGFESPPPTRRNLSAPPPLIRPKNRIRPKTDDESGKSSDSDGDETKTYTRTTYNLRRLAGVRDETNNNKSTKVIRTLRKRVVDDGKAIEMRNVSPVKRTKKTSTTTTTDTLTGPSFSKTSTKRQNCDNNLNPYSELHYLESIGSIRTIRRAKHPGINKVPMSKMTATPFISPESQNGWDRKTKLKISYRIGLIDDDIQFALIIYEPMTMVIRRNLLAEFQKAAEEEEEQRSRSTAASPKIPSLQSSPMDKLNQSKLMKTPLDRVKSKIERPSSLRRLRF